MLEEKTIDRRHFLNALAGALISARFVDGRAAWVIAQPPRRWTAVQRLLDGYVADKKMAGAAAALSYGGSPLVYPSAGKIALDSTVRFDENSLCRIYSMTKLITGVAVMMLVEEGKLALDQPAPDILPEFRRLSVATDIEKGLGARPAVKTMTIRHLLTHTSGLSYWTPGSGVGTLSTVYRERGITPGNYGARLNRPGYGPQARNLTEMVERIAELPLLCEPGTAYNYSMGLDVLGLVIERVTGKGFDVFLRERLFDPLDMGSTGFQVAPKNAARLTTNSNVTPEGLRPTDSAASSAWLRPPTLLAGGGGLISTARDFARFNAMLLGDGALGRVRVLKPKTVRLTRSNLLPAGVVYSGGDGVGAGGILVLRGSNRRFGPVGSFAGGGAAGTLWLIDPSRRGNMVFMSQHMPPNSYPIREDMADAIEADLKPGKD